MIFESNQIVQCVKPDLSLAVRSPFDEEAKPSFGAFASLSDGVVLRGERDEMAWTEKPVFKLADLARVPAEMEQWVRERLRQGEGAA